MVKPSMILQWLLRTAGYDLIQGMCNDHVSQAPIQMHGKERCFLQQGASRLSGIIEEHGASLVSGMPEESNPREDWLRQQGDKIRHAEEQLIPTWMDQEQNRHHWQAEAARKIGNDDVTRSDAPLEVEIVSETDNEEGATAPIASNRSGPGIIKNRLARIAVLRNMDPASNLGVEAVVPGMGPEPKCSLLPYLTAEEMSHIAMEVAMSSRNGIISPLQRDSHPVDTVRRAKDIAASEPELALDDSQPLTLELRIPLRLQVLQAGPQGPVQRFLRTLHMELSRSARIPLARFVVLDVRGEHMQLDVQELEGLVVNESDLSSRPDVELGSFNCSGSIFSKAQQAWCCKTEDVGCPEQSLVDIEVLPAAAPADTPACTLAFMRWQLLNGRSSLRQGQLGQLLANASLRVSGLPRPSPREEARGAQAVDEARSEKSSTITCSQTMTLFWAAAVALTSVAL